MRIDKTSAAIGAATAIIVGGGGIAYAAIANADTSPSPSPSGSTSSAPKSPAQRGQHMKAETELSGDTAAKVKAAILAKLPGATIERMSAEDPGDGTGAAYEAHVTKSDGTHVQVLLSKAFAVTTVSADRGPGGHDGFGGGPGHNEPELSGATAASVKAAVLAKLPGATVDRMSTEDAAESSGAAYEAQVTKKDGTHVKVLLDKSFKVLSVTAGRAFGGHDGPGDRHGAPPASGGSTTGSSYTTSA
jgi:hypothetical protein